MSMVWSSKELICEETARLLVGVTRDLEADALFHSMSPNLRIVSDAAARLRVAFAALDLNMSLHSRSLQVFNSLTENP